MLKVDWKAFSLGMYVGGVAKVVWDLLFDYMGWDVARFYTVRETSSVVTFQNIVGADYAKKRVLHTLNAMFEPRHTKPLTKGFVLTGPPGTGKSLFASAVAGELALRHGKNVKFVELKSYINPEYLPRILDVILSKHAPCVIYVDEAGHMFQSTTVANYLATKLEDVNTKAGKFVFLCCTNEKLPDKVTRSGRLDLVLQFEPPMRDERLQLLRKLGVPQHLLEQLSSETEGCTQADLVGLCKQVDLHDEKEKESLYVEYVHRLRTRTLASGVPKQSEKDQHRIAVHECGHALIGYLSIGCPIRVHLTADDVLAGYTLVLGLAGKVKTVQDVRNHIAVLLGGTLAEELVFGERSTLCENDFQQIDRLLESIQDCMDLCLSKEEKRVKSRQLLEEIQTNVRKHMKHSTLMPMVEALQKYKNLSASQIHELVQKHHEQTISF